MAEATPAQYIRAAGRSDDALRLAMAVGRILEENGYDVSYTRTTDATQSVGQKAAIANEEGADLFVSIHRNAAEYPGKYTGVQTLIYDDSGIKKEIAQNINANLERLGFRNAGVSIRPNLVVLNSTQMPALLVEAGFIDSDKDNQLFDSRFQAIAQGIADGIMETLENQNVSGGGNMTGNSMGNNMGNNMMGGGELPRMPLHARGHRPGAGAVPGAGRGLPRPAERRQSVKPSGKRRLPGLHHLSGRPV